MIFPQPKLYRLPNLKLLPLGVVEISRGFQHFQGASWPPGPDPVNFGFKSCFWQHCSMTTSYIPNLMSLAKIVAERSRGSENSGVIPQPRPPQILVQKVVLACYSPNTSCMKNLKLSASVAAEINGGRKTWLCQM